MYLVIVSVWILEDKFLLSMTSLYKLLSINNTKIELNRKFSFTQGVGGQKEIAGKSKLLKSGTTSSI